MLGWLRRILFAMSGGAVASLGVALVEARSAVQAQGGTGGPRFVDVAFGDAAVLAPVALAVSVAVAVSSIFLEPERAKTLGEHLRAARGLPVFRRSRAAAAAPLVSLVACGWLVIMAHVAKRTLAEGAPLASGLELAAASVGALCALLALGLAVLPPLRRALASAAASHPVWIDPVVTGAVGLGLAIVTLGVGVAIGDTSGGGPTPLAIFGVLKRSELDLRPVVNLLGIALTAYLAVLALGQKPGKLRAAIAGVLVLGSLGGMVQQAKGLNDKESAARAIERFAPLGKLGLQLVRRVTDRDHDKFSPYYAGGDCNDRDRSINPLAVDVPGNGIDEDCSGEDTPLPRDPEPKGPVAGPAPAERKLVERDLNLILITIDTLRTDVGFMGYSHPVTPNLDKLAEESVVFERAYSLASYTGKSLPPMLIGRYPNETFRDGGHFNVYGPQNVFVAERMKEAGIHTLGLASHWYFSPKFGWSQGMDVWDQTAMPADSSGSEDTTTTSDKLTDAAIKLLSNPDHSGKRFFMWVHYVDPHAQYVPHEGVPDLGYKGGLRWGLRGLYDGEVWFTDKHVGRLLDFVRAQPWGKDTAYVVTSDHGEAFNDHGMSNHGVELWEVLQRVPLVVHVPGNEPHRVPVKRSAIDVVPTLLDIMRIPQPGRAELSGDSLVPDLVKREGYEERDVLMDMPAGPYTPYRRALIHGDSPGMKLIHFGGRQYQLFDLGKDPNEADDLSGNKELLKPMVSAFEAKKGQLRENNVEPDRPIAP